MEETPDMKEITETRMRTMYLAGESEEAIDAYLYGVLEACHAQGIETPVIWTLNYMCGRVDRLYMTDEEWDAINAEY